MAAPFISPAQRVIYSDNLPRRGTEQFLFAGQAGHHYWIEKDLAPRSRFRDKDNEPAERRLMLMDERMQPETEIDLPALGMEKAWLVAGREFFDQLSVRCTGGKTQIELLRYTADGSGSFPLRVLDSLPYSANPGQLLLCRSTDRSRLLLMAFENLADETTRVHTLLFDQNWQLLERSTLTNPGFSQPCIQDDVIGLPGESFDNLPIKLGNQGDWVMTSVSTSSGRFVLVHGCAGGKTVSMKEMPLNAFFQMEDVAMDIDEQKGECSIGLLSRYRKTSLKHVRVSRYNLSEDRFVFDSAYHFNSLSSQLYNSELVNESFVGIPGGGYMLFKEYGRSGIRNPLAEESAVPGDPVFFATLFSGGPPVPASLKEDSYLKKSGLQGMRSQFDRGNLSMFYFPALSGDSTWSGLINTRQKTELNKPALSYLIFPYQAGIFILYHAGEYGFSEPATTIALDRKGDETGDAVIFWKFNRNLDFQQAVRFAPDQIAVPFQNNQLSGFALIRLKN